MDNSFFIDETPSDIQIGLDKYEYLRITDKTVIKDAEPRIKIGDAIVGVPNDISSISGLPKAGKSSLVSMIISGSITQTSTFDIPKEINVKLNDKKQAVIHFDTEQAPKQQQHHLDTILKRARLETCPDYYLSYNIKALDFSEYTTIVDDICFSARDKHNGVYSIFIDGGADFVASVNDDAESIRIVKYFEKLAGEFKCPVIIVIHTNPGISDKERGSIGSHIQRKDIAAVQVKSDKNGSYLEGKRFRYCNMSDLPRVNFTYDKSLGYHVANNSTEVFKTVQEQGKDLELNLILNKVFGADVYLGYKEAWTAIGKVGGKGETIAKNTFTALKKAELIIQGADGKWYRNDEVQ